VRPSIFDRDTPFEYASNFKALLEGIFHRQLKSKNRFSLEPSLSSIQYTFNLNSDQKTDDISNDETDSNSDSDEDSGSDYDSVNDKEESLAEKTIDSVELVTINFKFSSRKLDGQGLNAMRQMLHSKVDSMTNYHIDLVMEEDSDHVDGNLLTKEDFLTRCSRSKRSAVGCFEDDDAELYEIQ
uniref:Uncharacterized protein n=1 Tax=Romanomermis culicivorax TaxID=13658 RepID=A0A915KTY4_ROMCU